MLKDFREFINSKEFEMNICKDNINIINYKRIVSISPTSISIQVPSQKILITGNNLSLKKMLDDEILITGTIYKIEVFDE